MWPTKAVLQSSWYQSVQFTSILAHLAAFIELKVNFPSIASDFSVKFTFFCSFWYMNHSPANSGCEDTIKSLLPVFNARFLSKRHLGQKWNKKIVKNKRKEIIEICFLLLEAYFMHFLFHRKSQNMIFPTLAWFSLTRPQIMNKTTHQKFTWLSNRIGSTFMRTAYLQIIKAFGN